MLRTHHQVAVRVSREFRAAFEKCARENNRTSSQLIRDFMADYLRAAGRDVPPMMDITTAGGCDE